LEKQPELRRALGLWAAIAVVIGTAIGSGIFLVPTKMVRAVGSPEMVFGVWIFGGILTLFGALTYAELSSMLPGAGGEYVYLNAAYGRFFGFIYGWTQTWVAKAASIATLGTAFFTYLSNFFPQLNTVLYTLPLPIGPGWKPLEIRYGQLLAIVVILFLAGVNYLGVRVGGGVQIGVTALKLAMIAGVVVAGLLSSHGNVANFHAAMPAIPGGVPGFFVALVAALWAYDGWNNAGMLGSEIERPQRNLPRALITGTLCIMAVYLLVNVAYFYILSGPEVGSEESRLTGVAAVMMRRILGAPGASLVSAAAMISIFAAMNGSILSGSRVPYAMARDGYFFKSLSTVHPKYRTPSSAILLLGVWSSVVLLSGQYDQLYTLVIFPSWILYGMTAASVIVLRIKRPDLERPYRVIGYPVVPVLFVFVAVALLYSTLRSSPRESGIGLAIIAAGLPFYFHWKRQVMAGGSPQTAAETVIGRDPSN
jgi:basic amino acid/polyamine antiporter, APA family